MPTFLFRTLVLNMQESSTPALGGSNRAWEVLGQSLAMYGVRSIRNSYGVYWLSRCLVPSKVPNTKHEVCDITRTVQRGGPLRWSRIHRNSSSKTVCHSSNLLQPLIGTIKRGNGGL